MHPLSNDCSLLDPFDVDGLESSRSESTLRNFLVIWEDEDVKLRLNLVVVKVPA